MRCSRRVSHLRHPYATVLLPEVVTPAETLHLLSTVTEE